MKSRYWKTSYKYGVRLSHSVQEALEIDKQARTDFWWKAIQKEVSEVMIACKFDESLTPEQLQADETAYAGFQEIKCHIIFDVKVDLIPKANFMAGGHLTEAPPSIRYSSIVSQDSVQLEFLIAALNDLEIIA